MEARSQKRRKGLRVGEGRVDVVVEHVEEDGETVKTRTLPSRLEVVAKAAHFLSWSAEGGAIRYLDGEEGGERGKKRGREDEASETETEAETETEEKEKEKEKGGEEVKPHPFPLAARAITDAVVEVEQLMQVLHTIQTGMIGVHGLVAKEEGGDLRMRTASKKRTLRTATRVLSSALHALENDLAMQRALWARIRFVQRVFGVVPASGSGTASAKVLLEYAWRLGFARSWASRLVRPGFSHPEAIGQPSLAERPATPLCLTIQVGAGEEGEQDAVFVRSLPGKGDGDARLLDLHDGLFDALMFDVMRVSALALIKTQPGVVVEPQSCVLKTLGSEFFVPPVVLKLTPKDDPSVASASTTGEDEGMDAKLMYILGASATLEQAQIPRMRKGEEGKIAGGLMEAMAHVTTVRRVRGLLEPLGRLLFVRLEWTAPRRTTSKVRVRLGRNVCASAIGPESPDPVSILRRITDKVASTVVDAMHRVVCATLDPNARVGVSRLVWSKAGGVGVCIVVDVVMEGRGVGADILFSLSVSAEGGDEGVGAGVGEEEGGGSVFSFRHLSSLPHIHSFDALIEHIINSA